MYFFVMDSRLLLSTIKLLSVEYTQGGTWWHYERVRNPFARLYLITGGEANVSHVKGGIRLVRGTLALIPSEVTCDYCCTSFMTHYHACLDMPVAGSGQWPEQFFPAVVADELCYGLFARLISLNPESRMKTYDPFNPVESIFCGNTQAHTSATRIESMAIITQLLARLLTPETVDPLPPRIRIVLDMVENSLHREITLREMAAAASLTPTYFSREFQRVTGRRPADYVRARRIERARALLAATDIPMKCIASDLGFGDVHYFMRVFRTVTGCTVAQFREKFFSE